MGFVPQSCASVPFPGVRAASYVSPTSLKPAKIRGSRNLSRPPRPGLHLSPLLSGLQLPNALGGARQPSAAPSPSVQPCRPTAAFGGFPAAALPFAFPLQRQVGSWRGRLRGISGGGSARKSARRFLSPRERRFAVARFQPGRRLWGEDASVPLPLFRNAVGAGGASRGFWATLRRRGGAAVELGAQLRSGNQ